MRFSCLAPMGIPRFAARDISILNGKYVIPTGTVVLGHIQQIIRDPKVFTNPDEFNPSRFLNEKGEFVKNNQNIVFGTGKRDCLGRSLAQVEFFLFYSSLMQNFNFNWAEGDDLENLSIKGIVGSTQSPKPFKAILTKRPL